jgi:SAM-dependent methyltransferase
MVLPHAVDTPRDATGMVDHDAGWKLWTDMVKYYPSGVHRRRLVAEWLKPHAPTAILDVGCGPGHMLDFLHGQFPGARFCGVDNAQETVEENRRRLPWCRFEPLDLTRERLPERFDTVVCSEVLEHVTDDESALGNLAAMTERQLLITVPTGTLFPLEAGFGHLRHYQLEPLCRRIERHGLRIVRAQAWGWPMMSAFKRAANLRPEQTMSGFGAGDWSPPKKLFGAALTSLFYLNVLPRGPQLLILAGR